MQSGELIVSGNSSITIQLENFPSEVKVRFKHELEITPCNPQHADYLEYEVHVSYTTHNNFALIITWNVSSVREIVWHAYY